MQFTKNNKANKYEHLIEVVLPIRLGHPGVHCMRNEQVKRDKTSGSNERLNPSIA